MSSTLTNCESRLPEQISKRASYFDEQDNNFDCSENAGNIIRRVKLRSDKTRRSAKQKQSLPFYLFAFESPTLHVSDVSVSCLCDFFSLLMCILSDWSLKENPCPLFLYT